MSKVFLTLILLSICLNQSAFSHAIHYEVQIKSELHINVHNQISGLNMVWRYDPAASEDLLKDEPNIQKLEKIVHSNLKRFNFFTKLKSNSKALITNDAQNFKLEQIEGPDFPYVQISFFLPFVSPPKLSTVKEIDIKHIDPTATAILYYENPKDITLGYDIKNKCKTSVEEKLSFDEGDFPQIVTIKCN